MADASDNDEVDYKEVVLEFHQIIKDQRGIIKEYQNLTVEMESMLDRALDLVEGKSKKAEVEDEILSI